MFEHDFMRLAFAAGGLVAIAVGTVGFFLVLRSLAFAGHALSHIGFAGAAGAALAGATPLAGLLTFAVAAGIGMGLLGEKLRNRDTAVGIVLTLALGFGVLFIQLQATGSTQPARLLFGNLLAVNSDSIRTLTLLTLMSLLGIVLIGRPLVFVTVAPELAEVKGVSLRLVSAMFLVIVAAAVAEATQVVGVLLVFALLIGPAATSRVLTLRIGWGIGIAIGFALIETWLGVMLAYLLNGPISFWIALLSSGFYCLALLWRSTSAKWSSQASRAQI